MTGKAKKYMNNAQIESLLIGAKHETIVAGRALGKSEGIDAHRMLRNVQAMQGSSGGLISNTYKKLLQNTLPAVAKGLLKFGYKRDVHYTLGRPPKKWNWPKAVTEPFDYEHLIYWYNGSTNPLLSLDRPMSANSMSLDYVLGFEARYLPPERIKEEIMPAIRGQRELFGHCPWHHGTVFTTDMPWLKSSRWIFDRAKYCDEELIQFILLTVQRKQEVYAKYTAGKLKDVVYRKYMASIEADLYKLRSQAHLYREYDTLENIEVLGKNYIFEQARELSPALLLRQIFNKRPKAVTDGFYSSLNDKIHYYEISNESYLDSLGYDFNKFVNDCRSDGDLIPKEPLHIALDYNTAINNLSVAQYKDSKIRTVNHLYVKTPRKVRDLVNDFCDYYAHHSCHDVIYYWDHTANWTTPDSGLTLSDIVISELKKRKWNVKSVYVGKAVNHEVKHEYINAALAGDSRYLFPVFNKNNCETLITAMEQTEAVTIGKKVKKKKNDEKKADSEALPDEYKTHGPDAWDTLFIGMNFYRPTIARILSGTSSII